MTTNHDTGLSRRSARWISWLLGGGMAAAVVIAGVHYSAPRAFLKLLQQAQPWWLAAAVILQAATYVAQGAVWVLVGAGCGYRLGFWSAIELSFGKLFADQALPSAGLSSGILTANALKRRDLPAPAVNASVLINVASYQLAYAVALAGALAIVVIRGHAHAAIVITSVLFVVCSIAVSAFVLAVAGRPPGKRVSAAIGKFRVGRTTIDFIAGANRSLVRSVKVFGTSTALQSAIVVLDAATLWLLILSLGERASVGGVFASFMISSLFRTLGVIPGGLGAFEASSVVTLQIAGIDLPVALSATMLFRGMSFWIPMLPGYWCSRRLVSAVGDAPSRSACGRTGGACASRGWC